MSNYQALFDGAFQAIQSENLGHHASMAMYSISEGMNAIRDEMTRPSVLYRPSIQLDGNQYCALLGTDLQVGVAGFGDTPKLAMEAFDKAWLQKAPGA